MLGSLRRMRWLLAIGSVSGCADGESEPVPLVTGELRFSAPLGLADVNDSRALIAVAEANDDGWLDVLTWGEGAPLVSVAIPNYGIGSPAKVAGLPTTRPRQVLWTDLNRDRSADLVILDDGGKVRHFVAQAVDEYGEQTVDLPDLPPLASFALADLNRDGRLDYVFLEAPGDAQPVRLHVVLGGSAGRFDWVQTLEFTANDEVTQSAAFLQPADVDADGDWDVVVAAPGLGLGVFVYEEHANGADAGVEEGAGARADAGADPDAKAPSDGGAYRDAGETQPDGETVAFGDGPFAFRSWSSAGEQIDEIAAVILGDMDADGVSEGFFFLEGSRVQLRSDMWPPVLAPAVGRGRPMGSIGCVEDFDNDGRVDILAASDTLDLRRGAKEANTFASALELDPEGAYPAASIVCVDLDNDGDVDVLTSGQKGTALHLNRLEPATTDDARYYDFKFVGRGDNAAALGTRVEVTVGDVTRRRDFVASGQAHLPATPTLHFGLGDDEQLDEVTITWPNGLVRVDTDWVANDTVTALQPE